MLLHCYQLKYASSLACRKIHALAETGHGSDVGRMSAEEKGVY